MTTHPISPSRAAILAALPQPILPRDSREARQAERLLRHAERRVEAGDSIEATAKRLWDRWLDAQ